MYSNPAALAASLRELRASSVAAHALEKLGDAGADLARLLREFESQLSSIGLADQPKLFGMAIHAVESRTDRRELTMPHVTVKLWPGKSEQQKMRLAEAIAKDVMDILHYGEEPVSVAF